MFLLNSFLPLMLEQNHLEKTLSIVGLIIMGIILFVFIVDSTARYKSDYVPRSRKFKFFLFLFFMLVIAAIIILFRIYYK